MATYAQLQAERWWGRETVTPELDWLGAELCRRTGRPRTAFGHKGNDRHLNGGHRSQEWILNSKFCTSRTYTVQSGLSAEQLRHIAAADFTPGVWGTAANRKLMAEQTKRLVAAMKGGQLPGVREVIGTLDGKTVVGTRADGSEFKSDSSHLDHWHLTFDRRRMRDRKLMERIVAVALGEDDTVQQEDIDKIARAVVTYPMGSDALKVKAKPVGDWWKAGEVAVRSLAEVLAGQRAILAAVGGLDTDAVLAAIRDVAEAEAARDAQAAAERAALLELAERARSGELDYEQLVAALLRHAARA